MTTSLNVALALKAQSPVPASVVLVKGQFEVVSKLQTMTDDQRAGLYVAWEWHKSYGRTSDESTFHPNVFETFGIAIGRSVALAVELRQMGLLQCHEGRYWLSPSGLNLVNLVNQENKNV